VNKTNDSATAVSQGMGEGGGGYHTKIDVAIEANEFVFDERGSNNEVDCSDLIKR